MSESNRQFNTDISINWKVKEGKRRTIINNRKDSFTTLRKIMVRQIHPVPALHCIHSRGVRYDINIIFESLNISSCVTLSLMLSVMAEQAMTLINHWLCQNGLVLETVHLHKVSRTMTNTYEVFVEPEAQPEPLHLHT